MPEGEVSRQTIDAWIAKIRAERARLQAVMSYASPPLHQRASEAIAINAQLTEPQTMDALKHGLDVGYGPAFEKASTFMVWADVR